MEGVELRSHFRQFRGTELTHQAGAAVQVGRATVVTWNATASSRINTETNESLPSELKLRESIDIYPIIARRDRVLVISQNQ
jgi:hypothetical protein